MPRVEVSRNKVFRPVEEYPLIHSLILPVFPIGLLLVILASYFYMKWTYLLWSVLLLSVWGCHKQQKDEVLPENKTAKELIVKLSVDEIDGGCATLNIEYLNEADDKDCTYGISFGENPADMLIIYQNIDELEDFEHKVYRLEKGKSYFAEAYVQDGSNCYKSKTEIFVAK